MMLLDAWIWPGGGRRFWACAVAASFASVGNLIWSPDGKTISYSALCGPPEPSLSHEELVAVDLQSTQSTVLFRGELGYSVDPVGWSEDRAVIYRYFNAATSERYVKDTKGRTYAEVDRYYNLVQAEEEPPEESYSGLENVTGWSKNASGEWLVSGGTHSSPHWIGLVPPGAKKASEVVSGSWPAWRPGVGQ
jgi:hypothetical protein